MKKRSLTSDEKANAHKIQTPLSASEFTKLRRKLSNVEYPDSNWVKTQVLVGIVFYITRVWEFVSEEFGPKIGLEVETDTGEKFVTSLAKNDERAEIATTFRALQQTHGSKLRIGPFTFEEIFIKQGFNPYLKLVQTFRSNSTTQPSVTERKPRGRKPKSEPIVAEPIVAERKPRGRKPKSEPIVAERKPRARKPKSDDVPF